MNNVLHFLLLFCLQRFNGERSLSAVFHLLSGKKSAQTLQDSKWFRLERVFGICKDVSMYEIEQAARELLKQRWIAPHGERSYILTDAGRRELEQQLPSAHFLQHMNGFLYHSTETLFWYRLSLVVQTISNLVHQRSFEPIHRHEATFIWVKRYLLSQKRPIAELAKALYEELYALCSSLSEEKATIVTLRLTSFERIGWTNEQLAVFFQTDPLYVQFMFHDALHYIMERAEREATSFPILHELVKDLVSPLSLTKSAHKTYEWLRKGKTIEEVARIRGLKRSTIEDHVVEIAANVPEFSIEPLIDAETIEKVVAATKRLGTKQLKKIREAVGEHVSYFEIRLVLAKEGENSAS
ncbi:helix-turn-helix domain-containing protein [Anoxybacteroides tepidamans]|uniref:helix-turn-helix domain-containing protein n=1 Tax=Anoxybacteroides tepidamans TaxID=265948 RepID=UPI00054E9F98|nr:helix-turn-helix domain-containing protein [Anoxybacillus tepidamans]